MLNPSDLGRLLALVLSQTNPTPALPVEPPYTLPPARTIGLDAAIDQALKQNPSVLQTIEELGRAQAIVEETRAPALPQLTFNGVFTQMDNNRVEGGLILNPQGVPTPINTVVIPQTQLNLNVQLVLPILLPQRWAQWAHSTDQVEVARISVAESQRQLAIAVGHNWLSLLAQHNVVDLDAQAVVTDQGHADYTEARYKGGFGNKIDYVRAVQQVASDKSQLETALAQVVRLRESLGVLLASADPVDVGGDMDLGQALDVQVALDAAAHRPDVVQNELRLTAASHVVRDDYTDYLPTLNVIGFPFFQDPATPTIPSTGWEIEAVLQWTIYDGGLRYGLAHERAHLKREAELGFENTQRQAASDVRTSAEALARSQAASAQAIAAAKLAAQALELATIAYKAGAVTNIEVIDAEQVSHDAQIQSVSATDAERQAQFDLLTSAGRIPGQKQQ